MTTDERGLSIRLSMLLVSMGERALWVRSETQALELCHKYGQRHYWRMSASVLPRELEPLIVRALNGIPWWDTAHPVTLPRWEAFNEHDTND